MVFDCVGGGDVSKVVEFCGVVGEYTGRHHVRVCSKNNFVYISIIHDAEKTGKYIEINKLTALKIVWDLLLAIIGIDP